MPSVAGACREVSLPVAVPVAVALSALVSELEALFGADLLNAVCSQSHRRQTYDLTQDKV